MSTDYRMSICISGHDKNKEEVIKDAAADEWPFEAWDNFEDEMNCTAEDSLHGEMEEECAERLTVAIWEANETYCDVVVTATCLEYVPFEEYHLDKKEYEVLMSEE